MPSFGNNEEGMPWGPDEEERRKRKEIKAKRDPNALDKKWQDEDRAELEIAERMMAPPVKVEPRCRVCTSQWRLHVERQLLRHHSYRVIAGELPPDPTTGHQITARNIRDHVNNGHMPVDKAAVRLIMENEADLLQQNYEEGVKGSFTMRGALDIMIRKAYDDAMANITTIEPRDLIQMVKLYNDLNVDSGTAAMEEAKAIVRIYTDAIKDVLSHGDFVTQEEGTKIMAAIAFEVQRLRSLEEISSNPEAQLELPRMDEPIEDAEVLDPDG